MLILLRGDSVTCLVGQRPFLDKEVVPHINITHCMRSVSDWFNLENCGEAESRVQIVAEDQHPKHSFRVIVSDICRPCLESGSRLHVVH